MCKIKNGKCLLNLPKKELIGSLEKTTSVELWGQSKTALGWDVSGSMIVALQLRAVIGRLAGKKWKEGDGQLKVNMAWKEVILSYEKDKFTKYREGPVESQNTEERENSSKFSE